jgi:hypothetical protein
MSGYNSRLACYEHAGLFSFVRADIGYSEAGMISRSLLFAAMVGDWVLGLKNNVGGSCCDTADGFPVEVDGWDMAGTVDDTSAMRQFEASIARSGYRVWLADGKWHDVPNFALVDPRTNKLCYAVVWLQPATFNIRCFLPGAGG